MHHVGVLFNWFGFSSVVRNPPLTLFLVQLKGIAASAHDKKANGGIVLQLHPFLIWALSACECKARSGRRTPGNRPRYPLRYKMGVRPSRTASYDKTIRV
jgi:hypothetical protein